MFIKKIITIIIKDGKSHNTHAHIEEQLKKGIAARYLKKSNGGKYY